MKNITIVQFLDYCTERYLNLGIEFYLKENFNIYRILAWDSLYTTYSLWSKAESLKSFWGTGDPIGSSTLLPSKSLITFFFGSAKINIKLMSMNIT